jgi:hypothetical protein
MTIPEIFKLLNDLGDSSQKVADNLRQQGIKGYRFGDGGPCPINQYLINKGVDGCNAGVCSMSLPDETEMRMPSGVIAFVRDFDNIKYYDMMVRL